MLHAGRGPVLSAAPLDFTEKRSLKIEAGKKKLPRYIRTRACPPYKHAHVSTQTDTVTEIHKRTEPNMQASMCKKNSQVRMNGLYMRACTDSHPDKHTHTQSRPHQPEQDPTMSREISRASNCLESPVPVRVVWLEEGRS